MKQDKSQIENNGWIKIKSENDLPKEEIDCFYRIVVPERYSNAGEYINCGRFRFKSFIHSTTQYFTSDDIIRHHYTRVTHYQPITKPKSPIY